MASIGLKVNHSTVGTDMASSLAKIMGSSTTDAINIARLKSELLNDEVARNAAIAADVAARQKAKRENYIHGVTIDSGSVLGKVLYDQQGRPIAPSSTSPRSSSTTTAPPATLAPEAVNATEPPEVVGEPAYAAEPDWEYRVNPMPLVSDEAPLPIELPALPQQLTGVPPDLAARPPMPPALTGLPPELLEPPAPIQLPDMPPELTGVPEDLVDRPVVGSGSIVGSGGALGGPPVIGGSPSPLSRGAGQPPVGGSQTIRDMLAGMNAPARAPIPVDQTAGLELPVPVDLPPEYFTPPAALDLKPGDIPIQPPMPDTAALAGVPPELQPYPELPDTAALGGVPPELQPIPIGEPEVIKLPGRPAAPAVSPETTAATVATPSDVAAAAPAAATAAPAAGAPAAKPAGSVGTGTVEPDGGSVYQTEAGPVRLTREETDKLGLAIAFNNDPAGQLSKLSSVLKTTYDPGVTLTPNQKAELLAGQSPIGTPEETASKIAIENAKPTKLDEGVVEVDKRKYQISIGPDGKKRMDLIAGQPEGGGGVNPYGDSSEGNMRYFVDNLLVKKPDPKTWDAQEKRHYATMVEALWGTKVTVSADGTVTVIEGKPPVGVLPGDTGFKTGAVPPPTVSAEPAAEPATATPASTAPAATPTVAPDTAAPPAGGVKKNKHGRYVEVRNGIEVPNFGGYRSPGQPAKEAITQQTAGGTVTKYPSEEGPAKATETASKAFNFIDQSLRSAKYMLDLNDETLKKNLTPGVLERVAKAATDGTVLESIIAGGGVPGAPDLRLSENDREYFRNVLELVKDFSHKDSGADVTANDLQTYKALFDLPANPSAKDLVNLQTTIKDNIASARRGFIGQIPGEALRELDFKMAQLGIDPDEPVSRPAKAPAAVAGAGGDYQYTER